MFWISLLAMTLAASLVKLGSASVMVGMLTIALKCAVLVLVLLTTALLWRHVLKK